MNSRTEIIGFSMCVIVCISFVLHGFLSSEPRYKAVVHTNGAGDSIPRVTSFDTWTGEFKAVLRQPLGGGLTSQKAPPQIIDLQDLDSSK